jgi:hypothetical protein
VVSRANKSPNTGGLGRPVSINIFNFDQHATLPVHVDSLQRRKPMTEHKAHGSEPEVSRDGVAELLNEDLAREYQAIISYVAYSQVLKGAEYMSIAGQLELHAQQELKHALIISQQIDYLARIIQPIDPLVAQAGVLA